MSENEKEVLRVVHKSVPTQLSNGLWQPCIVPVTYYTDGSLETVAPSKIYTYALNIEFHTEEDALKFGKEQIEREYGDESRDWM